MQPETKYARSGDVSVRTLPPAARVLRAAHPARSPRRGAVRSRERPPSAGDGFLASFDGPARAIRCALAAGDRARVAASARPGEVLVSSTVRDLVAGSGIRFEDRGAHALKGVPGEWTLYAVAP